MGKRRHRRVSLCSEDGGDVCSDVEFSLSNRKFLKGAELHFVPTIDLERFRHESQDIFPCEDGSLSQGPSSNFWRPLLILSPGREVVLWQEAGVKASEAVEKSTLLGSTLPATKHWPD